MTQYGLSLKQPWAALLINGCKSIEVRRWATTRRGLVLIHAARIPDPRPEAWAQVPPELREATQLMGGVIGAAELTGVKAYRSAETFVADQRRHLNDPSWYQPPCLYGFIFANPRVLPFRAYKGNVRFFTVEDPSEKNR